MPVPVSNHPPGMFQAPTPVGLQPFASQGFPQFMTPYAQMNAFPPFPPGYAMHGSSMPMPSSHINAMDANPHEKGAVMPFMEAHRPAQPSGPPTGPMAAPVAVPSALSARPSTFGPATNPQIQCRWEIAVAQQQSPTMRLLDLTWLDKYFYSKNTPTQVVGFRFTHALDPSRVAQSLQLAIHEYPVIGSKVVVFGGQHKFQLDEERVIVHLVHVSPDILRAMPLLSQLCDLLYPRSIDQKRNPLFHAFLFRSTDPAHGSALVCGFQHCIGDAMSYAMFLRRWSQSYSQLASKATSSPPPQLPPEVFSASSAFDPLYKRNPLGPRLCSFFFSKPALAALKKACAANASETLSTNDILCAQAAVALAPFRFRQSGLVDLSAPTRIVMLIDFRGLSVPEGTWGNRWADIAIDLPWSELLSGSVLQVARRIRAVLKERTEWLEKDCDRFNAEKCNRQEVPKLFTWNSWAKAGRLLREVEFKEGGEGKGGLQEMKWFNAAWLPVTDVVVVEPLAGGAKSEPQLAVRVASPRAEAEGEVASLKRFWGDAKTEWEA